MPELYERAVISAFQEQVNQGIEVPLVQLKTIERRLRSLSKRSEQASPNLEALIGLLAQGICVQLNDQKFVAQLDELLTQPQGNLIKWLSANVDKKTNNPKTSRGTVWRRNSTVRERRRISPNWKNGSTAQAEAKRKSRVQLIPYDVWKGQADAEQTIIRQQQIALAMGKRERRSTKKLQELELEKRVRQGYSPEEKNANELIELLSRLVEKNGLTNQSDFFQRIVRSQQLNQALPVVSIWGPPYEKQGLDQKVFSASTPESKLSNEIEQVLIKLSESKVEILPIIIFADVYGLEINGVPLDEVKTYFESLWQRFSPTSLVIPWSEIRAENIERYLQLKSDIDPISVEVSEENIQNAIMIQAKLGKRISTTTAIELAKRYKVERLIEGQILTEGFQYQGQTISQIIKLGTASSRLRNDEPYEQNLPRFYVKNMNRAAWNQARNTYD